MTMQPPTGDDRELDRWVQEVTDSWQLPPLHAGEVGWHDRLRPGSRGQGRRGIVGAHRLAGRVAVSFAALGVVAVVGVALVLSAAAPPGGMGAPGTNGGTPLAAAQSSPPVSSDSPRPTTTPMRTVADTTAPTSNEPIRGSGSNRDFELTIEADEPRYVAEQPILVTATLTYVGTEPRLEVASSGQGLVSFRIEDLDGPVDMDPVRTSDCRPYTYGAGDVQTVPFMKSGGYSPEDPMGAFWQDFFADAVLRLPAGRYRLSAIAQYLGPGCTLPELQVVASVDIVVG